MMLGGTTLLSPIERIRVLTMRVQLSNDLAARHMLIQAHLGMAYNLAFRFCKSHENPDLVQAAVFSLVDGVDRVAKGALYNQNIGAYLYRCIIGGIYTHIREDKLIPVPRNIYKRNGSVPIIPLHQMSKEAHDCLIAQSSHYHHMDYDDICIAIDVTEREKEILDLRMCKHTLQEIGDKLGYTKEYIRQLIEKVKKRYQRYMKRELESIGAA
jgi:RNA polymerase sigma factor (sigma-70 family)